jgi:urease accessory protein
MADTLYRLLTLLSPAFPTGGYAHSHALEWSVDEGEIADAATLRSWIGALLEHGGGRVDAAMVRMAHGNARVPATLSQIAVQCGAFAASRERRQETIAIGTAFGRAVAAWDPELPALPANCPYPVAVGAVAAWSGIDEDTAALGYLQAWTANLVSAGVRLIPLGQSDGLRVLAGLESAVICIANSTRGMTEADLGVACFRADIASMHHETQYTRLFRT